MNDLRTTLRAQGQRLTAQRQAIYAALGDTCAHPTAEELFLCVRGTVPGISLATVYNTLDTLVANGLAIKLLGEGSARYDACVAPHVHARCEVCGRVDDLHACVVPALADLPMPAGFTPRAVAVEVLGRCTDCTSPAETVSTKDE